MATPDVVAQVKSLVGDINTLRKDIGDWANKQPDPARTDITNLIGAGGSGASGAGAGGSGAGGAGSGAGGSGSGSPPINPPTSLVVNVDYSKFANKLYELEQCAKASDQAEKAQYPFLEDPAAPPPPPPQICANLAIFTAVAVSNAIKSVYTSFATNKIVWPVRLNSIQYTINIQLDVGNQPNRRILAKYAHDIWNTFSAIPKETAKDAVQKICLLDCLTDIIATGDTFDKQYREYLTVTKEMQLVPILPNLVTAAIQLIYTARNGTNVTAPPPDRAILNGEELHIDKLGQTNPLRNHIIAAAYTFGDDIGQSKAREAFIKAVVSQLVVVNNGLNPVNINKHSTIDTILGAINGISSAIDPEELVSLVVKQDIDTLYRDVWFDAIAAIHRAIQHYTQARKIASNTWSITARNITTDPIVQGAAITGAEATNRAATILNKLPLSGYSTLPPPTDTPTGTATELYVPDDIFTNIVRSRALRTKPKSAWDTSISRPRSVYISERLTAYLGINTTLVATGVDNPGAPLVENNAGNPDTDPPFLPPDAADPLTNGNILFGIRCDFNDDIFRAYAALNTANIENVSQTPVQQKIKATAANECHDLIVDLFARALVLLYRSANIPNSIINQKTPIVTSGGGSFEIVEAMQEDEQTEGTSTNEQEKQEQEQEQEQENTKSNKQEDKQQEDTQEEEQLKTEHDGGKQGKTKRSPKSKPLRRSKKANRV